MEVQLSDVLPLTSTNRRCLVETVTSTTTQSLSQHSQITTNTSHSRSAEHHQEQQEQRGGEEEEEKDAASRSSSSKSSSRRGDSSSKGENRFKKASEYLKELEELAPSASISSMKTRVNSADFEQQKEHELQLLRKKAQGESEGEEPVKNCTTTTTTTVVDGGGGNKNSSRHSKTTQADASAAASQSRGSKGQGKGKQLSTNTTNTHLKPLPWKEQDSQNLREQVAFWKNTLLEDDVEEFVQDGGGSESTKTSATANAKLPKETIRELLKTIYTLLRKDSQSRKDHLLTEISEQLQNLEMLDLENLVQVMTYHEQTGKAMEGQNVLLLSGAVGSGKTTTLHFLAGTQFKEVEVDGFIHFQPKTFNNDAVSNYTTACGREAVTKELQLAQVKLPNNEGSVIICDTPGPNIHGGPGNGASSSSLSSPSSVEQELAYKYAIGPSLDKAKRVKPIVVMNNELMGSFFSSLPETLAMMTSQFDLKTARDLRSMDYVFTHYEERHRTRLCQQFASLKAHPPTTTNKNKGDTTTTATNQDDLLENLIDDMIKKTKPKANIVMPLDDDPQELLSRLWKETFIEEPRDLFHYHPSPLAMKKLKWQLQIALDELRVALCREDYSVALNRMLLLEKLSTWFPEARTVAQQAGMAVSQHVRLLWDYLCQEIQETNYDIVLARMDQITDFGLIFKEASECCRNGHDLLWGSLVSPMENKDYGLSIERISKLAKLGHKYTEANGCVRRSLRLLRKKVEAAVEQGEYMDAMNMMVQLSSLETEIPEAGDCARHLLLSLRSFLETVIERKDYTTAMKMIRKFSTLRDLYIEAGDFSNRGLVLIRKSVENAMEQGDYDSATFLVRHMQESERDFEEAGDIVQYGMHLFDKTMNQFADEKDFRKAIPLMKQISKDIPGSEDIVRKVLTKIRAALKSTIGIQDYESALELIYQINSLAKVMPEADACIEYGFNALEENILISIDKQEYDSTIHLMELLSIAELQLPLAKECTRVAVEVLKRNVSKAIETKQYSPALDMIMELSDKGHRLPEVGECSRRGLEMLRSTAEAAIGQRDYDTAIEIISNLSELTQSLPEAYTCTQHGLQAIVKHVTELRQTAERTVEEIRQVRDLKVFVAMLLKLKSQLDKVMKSEPLRKLSVQIHYKKHFRSKEDESSNDSKVLFVPQLYASHAFCSDHIEQLAKQVQERLPSIDVDESMENLIRNRKAILSAMIRLKALNKILGGCAGGDKASTVYSEAFEQFFELVESMLSLAEKSFQPPLDMRVFELQAWFLSVLVKGFIKDKIDVDSEERTKMEELESRRRLLMLRFEVQITDAVEILSDQEFIQEEEEESDDINKKLTVTSQRIRSTTFSGFTEPRSMLMNLCQRPELFKMVLRQITIQDLEKTIQTFDVSVVKYLGEMIQCVDSGYRQLLEMAKPGGGLQYILKRATPLLEDAERIQDGLNVIRGWSASEFVSQTLNHQRRLTILRKRIEIAVEKLNQAIQSEAEISFASFMKDLATSFVCDGKWHEDRLDTYITNKSN